MDTRQYGGDPYGGQQQYPYGMPPMMMGMPPGMPPMPYGVSLSYVFQSRATSVDFAAGLPGRIQPICPTTGYDGCSNGVPASNDVNVAAWWWISNRPRYPRSIIISGLAAHSTPTATSRTPRRWIWRILPATSDESLWRMARDDVGWRFACSWIANGTAPGAKSWWANARRRTRVVPASSTSNPARRSTEE